MKEPPATLAFTVSVQDRYGARYLVAEAVYVNPNGELRNPVWQRFDQPPNVKHLADFSVRARISRDMGVFGMQCVFKPLEIDEGNIGQAESIVRVLRKVHKGLARLDEEQGYVSDFAQYLFRVAQVLGIRTYYAQNTEQQRDMTGHSSSPVTAPSLQYRIGEWEKQYGKPTTANV